jgi:hypothetical protein
MIDANMTGSIQLMFFSHFHEISFRLWQTLVDFDITAKSDEVWHTLHTTFLRSDFEAKLLNFKTNSYMFHSNLAVINASWI